MPPLVDAALATKVRWVSSVTEATVPIATPPGVVLRTLPTFICVKKRVPTPVTAVDVFSVVMVPVRGELVHAEELQFPPPVPLEVIVAEKATEDAAINKMNRPNDLKGCKIRFISDYHLNVKSGDKYTIYSILTIQVFSIPAKKFPVFQKIK